MFNRRVVVAANAFGQIVAWKVPQPVPGSAHAYKYRLALVVDGSCVLRYDNEAGKGDHGHVGEGEQSYTMVADFLNDVMRGAMKTDICPLGDTLKDFAQAWDTGEASGPASASKRRRSCSRCRPPSAGTCSGL